MPKFTNNFGQRKPRPPDPWGNPANPLAGLKNPYGSSANHLASPKIRMAAPKNPYGGSANHLASPKIRMAAPPTTWRA